MYDMMIKLIMNMKLIMKVSMIMIWYEMLKHWLVVYMCHTPPSSTIFYGSRVEIALKTPLKASVPESHRVVEGTSRDFRDHRSFGQSVDGRSDGECWTEPQFLQVFWYQAFVLEFFFVMSCHVNRVLVQSRGRDPSTTSRHLLCIKALGFGKRASAGEVKTWKSPVPRIFFLN